MLEVRLVIAAALAGVVLFVMGAVRLWFRYHLPGGLYNEQILKLLRADNRERALKLASLVRETPYGMLTIAALSQTAATDYRSGTGERALDVRERVAAQRALAMQRVTGATMQAVAGAALTLVAVALAGVLHLVDPWWSPLAAIVAGVAMALALRMRARIARDLAALAETLEPFM